MYLETGTFRESLVGLASSPSLGLYVETVAIGLAVRCSLLILR